MSSLTARQIGADARRVVSGHGRGRVLAVFAPVVYLEFPGSIVVVSREDVAVGPLALLTDAPAAHDFRRQGLVAGQTAEISQRGLVAGPLRVNLGLAADWTPPEPPAFNSATLSRGLAWLRAALPEEIVDLGLGGALTGANRLTAADSALVRAGAWLAAPVSEPVWARQLVGLGPGLTPSGDDFLGGAMVALHAIGRRAEAGRLWQTIAPFVARDTGPISHAFLVAAAHGTGSSTLHEALNATLAATDPKPALARLAETGHSSGWDALAGVVAVLDAVAGSTGVRAA